MLDLKELERKLDDALAKETPESIREWLCKNRSLNNIDIDSHYKRQMLLAEPEPPTYTDYLKNKLK